MRIPWPAVTGCAPASQRSANSSGSQTRRVASTPAWSDARVGRPVRHRERGLQPHGQRPLRRHWTAEEDEVHALVENGRRVVEERGLAARCGRVRRDHLPERRAEELVRRRRRRRVRVSVEVADEDHRPVRGQSVHQLPGLRVLEGHQLGDVRDLEVRVDEVEPRSADLHVRLRPTAWGEADAREGHGCEGREQMPPCVRGLQIVTDEDHVTIRHADDEIRPERHRQLEEGRLDHLAVRRSARGQLREEDVDVIDREAAHGTAAREKRHVEPVRLLEPDDVGLAGDDLLGERAGAHGVIRRLDVGPQLARIRAPALDEGRDVRAYVQVARQDLHELVSVGVSGIHGRLTDRVRRHGEIAGPAPDEERRERGEHDRSRSAHGTPLSVLVARCHLQRRPIPCAGGSPGGPVRRRIGDPAASRGTRAEKCDGSGSRPGPPVPPARGRAMLGR